MLTTQETADRLGVRRETVYAYVSRGLLTPLRGSRTHGSRFDPAQVERLRRRGRGRKAAGDRGVPTQIETRVSTVADDQLIYRGRDAVQLAGERHFEEVARFLVTGQWSATEGIWQATPAGIDTAIHAQSGLVGDVRPSDRMKVALAVAALSDPLRQDLRPPAVVATMRTVVATMVDALPSSPHLESASGVTPTDSIAARLQAKLVLRKPPAGLTRLLDTALSLLADHELAPSTLAARLAAASGADPYAVVLTGMNVGSGSVHGVSPLVIEDYLRALDSTDSPPTVLYPSHRLGNWTPGFGHPLYQARDPRAERILAGIQELTIEQDNKILERVKKVDELLDHVRTRSFPPPNAHFAIAALAYVSDLAPGSAEAIFVTARSVGWVAHAMEEYQKPGGSIRQRAGYVGDLSVKHP